MRRSLTLVLLAAAATPAYGEPAVPAFVEETATAGLATPYLGEWQFTVGGGVAVFDCDGDGALDVFLAGGEGPSGLYRNTSAPGGALTFEAAGLSETAVTGAYPLDIDSDGITDLAILRVGENLLMRGLGGCRFQRANEDWGFDGGDAWSTALSATWEAREAWPTIAIGNYVNRFEEAFPWGSCTDNWLHRPKGRGFAAPLPLTPSYCALSILFSDWDGSGRRDLRVSNDREYYKGGQEQLWHVEPGQPPRLYTEAEGWRRLRIWGMGIASRDLDADGHTELFLTSMADNKLQKLVAPQPGAPLLPQYADVALKAGVTAHRPYIGGDPRPSTAWHAQFEDLNNDGITDLFVAKGNVDKMPDFAADDPNDLLLGRPDGTFAEAGDRAGLASLATARGAAIADFNRDGWLDVIVVNRWQAPQVWRNGGLDAGNWIDVSLIQPAPNPDAVGAWVEVETPAGLQRREITVGGGHASGQTGPWHFGLGAAATARVRVTWPDGTQGAWQEFAANQPLRISRD